MKKTLTVNLNSIVYHIDEDAYSLLKKYLNNIKYYFRYIGMKNVLKIEQENQHVFNNLVTKGVGVVNLVPETMAALKGDDQDLTEQQKQFLRVNKYKLYSYVKNHPITAKYLAKAAKI